MNAFCQKTIPVLRIFDERKACEFYIDWLGFTLDWQHRFSEDAPLYMQISRDGLVLHLTEHHGDCCPGAKVFIETQRLDAFHREISARPYRFNRPGIETAPWNARCFEVIDPFGNRIVFNQTLD